MNTYTLYRKATPKGKGFDEKCQAKSERHAAFIFRKRFKNRHPFDRYEIGQLLPYISEVKPATKEQTVAKGRERLKLILSIAGVTIAILGAITFTEFIYEEALQQIGMSCFILRSVGTADEIRECGSLLQAEGKRVLGFVEKIGPLNPLTYSAFLKFAETTILQGRAYEKLGDYKDHRSPQVSLPYDSEEERLEGLKPGPKDTVWDTDLVNGTSRRLLNGWGE